MKNIEEKIKIVQGDITEMEVDAIVNAANNELILGAGVAGAIRTKGGPRIQEECNKIGTIPIGEAAVTTAGRLKAQYVIHAASMGFGKFTDENSLLSSVKNSLLRAEEYSVNSIAFPAIGTGIAGFPIEKCAGIMLNTIIKHLKGNSNIAAVYLVLYDSHSYEIFKKMFKEVIKESI